MVRNITEDRMVVVLRCCANGDCDDDCPYCDYEGNCESALMRDAAELMEGQG